MTETEAAARWKVASSDFGEVAIHYLKGDELVASFELIGLYIAPTFHGNEFVAQLREVLEARTAILGGPLVALREVIAEFHHVQHTQRYSWEECAVLPCVKVRAIAAAGAQQSADAKAAE